MNVPIYVVEDMGLQRLAECCLFQSLNPVDSSAESKLETSAISCRLSAGSINIGALHFKIGV